MMETCYAQKINGKWRFEWETRFPEVKFTKIKIIKEWRNHKPVDFVNVYALVIRNHNGTYNVITKDGNYISFCDAFNPTVRAFYTPD